MNYVRPEMEVLFFVEKDIVMLESNRVSNGTVEDYTSADEEW